MTKKYNYHSKHVELHESKGKKHVFYDGSKFIIKTPADLSAVLVDFVDENYAFIVEQFFSGFHSQKVIGLSLTNEINKDSLMHYYYDNYLYFVTKEYLVEIHMDYENNYKNGNYTLRPRISHSVKSLSYPSSLKMISGNSNPSVPEFQSIMKEFNSQFKEYVDQDKYEEQGKVAKQWLIDHGVAKGYNVVLENGKEVIKSYY